MELNLLYGSSDYYVPYTAASICSLLENNKDMETIRIYLLPQQISDENMKKLSKMIEEQYGRVLKVVDGSVLDEKFKQMGLPQWHGQYSVYYKLFFTQFIQEPIERLLYLDSDTIITGSLRELVDIDMQGRPIGLVKNIINNLVDRAGMGVPTNQQWFMSGMCLYDVAEWKKQNCEKKFEHHLAHVRNNYSMADEDLINVVMAGNVVPLPLKYNVENNPRFYTTKEIKRIFYSVPETFYPDEEIVNAVEGGGVIQHCMGGMCGHPWDEGNCHPLKGLYHDYLNKTPWKGLPDVKAPMPLYNKIQWWMYRFFPRAIYIPVMRWAICKKIKQ